MGFCPYFLHAQESDGGILISPFIFDPSTSLIGTDTTLFSMDLLLLLGEEVEVINLLSLNMPDCGESELFSGEFSESSCSETKKLLNLPSMLICLSEVPFLCLLLVLKLLVKIYRR